VLAGWVDRTGSGDTVRWAGSYCVTPPEERCRVGAGRSSSRQHLWMRQPVIGPDSHPILSRFDHPSLFADGQGEVRRSTRLSGSGRSGPTRWPAWSDRGVAQPLLSKNPSHPARDERSCCRMWGCSEGRDRGYPEPVVASDKSLRIVSSIRLVRVAGRLAEWIHHRYCLWAESARA